jgi:hypothetical protein
VVERVAVAFLVPEVVLVLLISVVQAVREAAVVVVLTVPQMQAAQAVPAQFFSFTKG